MKHWLCILFAVLFSMPLSAQGAERIPTSIGEGSELPLRVLTRPLASLYKDSSGTTVLQSNLPTFQSYFVYTRPSGEALETGTGWYEVGTDEKGTVVGWLKGDDIFEWKQTMCLAYTHPEGRHPVLMFEDEDALTALLAKDTAKRKGETEAFYSAIDAAAAKAATVPQDFPIISVEPKMAVDMSKQFYLLPILEHGEVRLDGREGRMLRIAAVSAGGEKARESSNLKTNPEYAKTAAISSEDKAALLENLKIDVVWVMDTTRSMEPFIDNSREVLRRVSKDIAADPALSGKLAFGLWAYRDSTSIADIEYNTKNFTPTLLPVDDFLKVMEGVKETTTDSVDVPEDVFSGIGDAIDKTAWRPDSVRIIILVGDAPAHELGHKWNASGQSEETLRTLVSESKITLFALHVMPPRTQRYNKVATKQFTTLAVNPGENKPMYWGINGNDVAGFAAASQGITSAAVNFLKAGKDALKPGEGQAKKEAEASSPPTIKNAPTPADIDRMLKAASVLWLGSQANAMPPRDIEAWVVDKDLIDPVRPSLEVRLLINKRQLDALSTLLSEVLKAGRDNQISGERFFTSLQAASAVAARNPDMLASAPTLADSGMIPSFLSGLPYTSQLMDMNNDLWASWGPDEQDSFLNRIDAKVQAYLSIHDNPEDWISLNVGDDPADYVTPVPLELLP